MEKVLEEKITALVKDRCNELLREPQNKNLDVESFISGYLYSVADHFIFNKKAC
jgi:hypothetical protein